MWDFNDVSANYCLTHITGIWVEHCCNWVLLIASWFFLEPLWSLKPLNSILLSEQKICSWIMAFLYVQVLPKTSLTIIIVQYLFDLNWWCFGHYDKEVFMTYLTNFLVICHTHHPYDYLTLKQNPPEFFKWCWGVKLSIFKATLMWKKLYSTFCHV